MARIPTITNVAAKPWRVHQGPGVLQVGPYMVETVAGVAQITGALVSVGLTEGAIEYNSNIETAGLESDQLYSDYAMVETKWSHQLTTSLDQLDVYNLALAMSYNQSAVSSSSMLSMNQYEPSPYRGVRVISEGARNAAADSATTQWIDFFKAKIVASGGISISRTAKSTIPITVFGLTSSLDIVGQIGVNQATTVPVYE